METDYLIIGAGATGLCFADQMLDENDSRMLIVDKRPSAGGHWADAYPFVELHQPASFYGVPSASLGTTEKATSGPNEGMMPLATGTEVLAHFQHCLEERLLASGRVTFLPLHEVTEDRKLRSLLSGEVKDITVKKKVVNAAFHQNSVPKTHTRAFDVEGVTCLPTGEAIRIASQYKHYLVVGAGKTGIDTVLFLMRMGAHPDQITWIMPRDSWLIDRLKTQPVQEYFQETIGGFVTQIEACAEATDADDFADRFEKAGIWMRIDPNVKPTMYHAATCSRKEMDELRRVKNIIRMGRVSKIEPGTVHLEGGKASIPDDTLAFDCTASAIDKKPVKKIFGGDTITCQPVRFPLITFSSTFLAHLEATLDNDDEKNRYASPVPLPDTVEQNFTTLLVGFLNQGQWRQNDEISAFILQSRLEPFSNLMANVDMNDPEQAEIIKRLQASIMPAIMNLQKLAQSVA